MGLKALSSQRHHRNEGSPISPQNLTLIVSRASQSDKGCLAGILSEGRAVVMMLQTVLLLGHNGSMLAVDLRQDIMWA